jgi:hypothetical protein
MLRVRRLGLAWIATLSVLGVVTTACSRKPDNAQLASDVQAKIRSDYRLQMARIQALASDGVVTLSGYVANGDQRAATVEDAAQVEGVRTVVDNLRLDKPQAANTSAPQIPTPSSLQKPAPGLVRSATRFRAPAVSEDAAPSPLQESRHSSDAQPSMPPSVTSTIAATPAAVPPASTGPTENSSSSINSNASVASNSEMPASSPTQEPEEVTLPSGTVLTVRLGETLSSEVNQKGDTFIGSLASPIMLDDDVVVPAEAGVQGRVVEVQDAGRFSGKPGLVVEVTRLAYNGRTYELQSNQFSKQGPSRTGRAAATVGGGAGVGALIGGILGGGRGAAIGAMVGAGAGTGIQASAKPSQVQLPAEAMLSFRLQAPLTVVPSDTLQRTPGAGPDSQDPFSSDDRPVLKRRPGSRPADSDTDAPSGNSSPDQNPPDDSTPPPEPN